MNIEQYRLMIAGGNYYAKLEGVATNLGQLDTYLSTRQNLKIDFDDSKSGDYNLLIDNFYNNGTGTIYMDSMPSIGEKQNYSIDWTKVVNNNNDSVVYSVGMKMTDTKLVKQTQINNIKHIFSQQDYV